MTGFTGGAPHPLSDAIPEATLDDVRAITASAPATGAGVQEPLVIDVREKHEWDAGHIPNTIHVPRAEVPSRIEALVPDRSRPLVMTCLSGARSFAAARTLRGMGYTNVSNFTGSYQAWTRAGLPVETASKLSDAQLRRYSRHLLIPEVGIDGQQRLLDSKVLLIGAGGLGSPAALYLAAAGVGTLGLVDFDVVDESNLQRQVLHTTDRVGEKKITSAAETIGALNPDVRVVGYDEMLGEDNVERIIAGYDVILDGTDTFEVRYTLNDAAVRAGIPVVHASVFRFEGQTTVFAPGIGPCYRCLYPTPPPPELAPGCAVAGVLGVVPGIMGLLETNEILKLLLRVGEPLIGRLLIFDALDASFTELTLRRDPECPACSYLWADEDAVQRPRTRAEPVPVGAVIRASAPIQILDRVGRS